MQRRGIAAQVACLPLCTSLYLQGWQGWPGLLGLQGGSSAPLLTHCSRSLAGSSPTEACQEGVHIFFARFVATERLGSEEREAAAVTKCLEEPVGQSWAHFQKSSGIKRFLEECRLLSTF